jgi:hypothetical protein
MALFTSLFAFNRVAIIEDNQMYLTKNITANLAGNVDRSNPALCKPFLDHLTIFVVASVAKGYPEAIPPSRRHIFCHLYNTSLE